MLWVQTPRLYYNSFCYVDSIILDNSMELSRVQPLSTGFVEFKPQNSICKWYLSKPTPNKILCIGKLCFTCSHATDIRIGQALLPFYRVVADGSDFTLARSSSFNSRQTINRSTVRKPKNDGEKILLLVCFHWYTPYINMWLFHF